LNNPYDQIAYRTMPRRQTHPDRLAAMARLFGMKPAPVTACRVLELGCGDGANLIPQAYYLPQCHFLGIDLAEAPIAAGNAITAELGLSNIILRAADLRDLGPDEGEFDYIFAHGLYSWIPADVRDRLLAVCRERLAPQGVAFVSYNVYPGRQSRQMIREILLYHTRAIEDPAQRIAAARRLLPQIEHEEAKHVMEHGDDGLFHDDLAPINDPVWFHEFAAHARRHGLQYLAEAQAHKTFDPAMGQAGENTADVIEREQYVDFRKLRRFRETLLCHEEIALDRDIGPARMNEFLFSEYQRAQQISGDQGVQAVNAVVQALHDTGHLPVPFQDLVPYAGSAELLGQILFALLVAGCANLHVHDFPRQATVTERPRASRLARYQVNLGSAVTSAGHLPVELDEIARQLVRLLDGTRTHEEIARELSETKGVPGLDEVRRHLPGSLHWLAGKGLLEG
jgi:SAM-dependent methyltransferase